MLSGYAQDSVIVIDGSDEVLDLDLVSNTTMRTALALILIVVVLLTLMLAKCTFKEMPISRRKLYYRLKRQIKDSEGLDQQVMLQVD